MVSDWESYYNSNVGLGSGYNHIIRLMARDMMGQTHGGEKALAGMIPVYSWLRSGMSEYAKARDYYGRTGQDPVYPADVSSLRPPTQSQITGGMPLPRMARTMDQLYTPDIVENVSVRMARPQLAGRQRLIGSLDDDVIDMEEY